MTFGQVIDLIYEFATNWTVTGAAQLNTGGCVCIKISDGFLTSLQLPGFFRGRGIVATGFSDPRHPTPESYYPMNQK